MLFAKHGSFCGNEYITAIRRVVECVRKKGVPPSKLRSIDWVCTFGGALYIPTSCTSGTMNRNQLPVPPGWRRKRTWWAIDVGIMQDSALIDTPVHGPCFNSHDESHRLPCADCGCCNVCRKRFKIANRFKGFLRDGKINIVHYSFRGAIRIEGRTKSCPIRQFELICLTDKRLLPRT